MAFDIGQITYRTTEGSITFPTNARTKFRSEPELDATGRTVKWVKCHLTVECYLSAGDYLGSGQRTCDNDFQFMRRVLESPAGRLDITNKGTGVFHVNRDSSLGIDINWGPVVRSLEWSPLGNISAFCSWEVEWCQPDSNLANPLRMVEFSWSSRWDIDQDGATIRTISGFATAPGFRNEAHPLSYLPSPTSNADRYRDHIDVECPLGFVRDRQSWEVSPAKNRLDFTIVDRQLPHEAYPIGITDMDCDWDLDTTTDKGVFTRFVFSFSGTAKAALNYPKSLALKVLRDEHDFRFDILLRKLQTSQGSVIPLPARYRVREKTKGADARRVHLSMAWILTVVTKDLKSFFPSDILIRTGFFEQKENSPQAWRSNMGFEGGPLHPRGHAQLSLEHGEDTIVDQRIALKDRLIFGGSRKGFLPFGKAADTLPFIPLKGAYHDWQCNLDIHTITGSVVYYAIGQGSAPVSLTENRVDVDRAKYHMRGSAIRYGAKPVIPELESVNKIKAIKIGIPKTTSRHLKNLNGVDIYEATWEIWYETKSPNAAKINDALINHPIAGALAAANNSNMEAPAKVVAE